MRQLDEINSEGSEEMLVNNGKRQSLGSITTRRSPKYRASRSVFPASAVHVCLSLVKVNRDL